MPVTFIRAPAGGRSVPIVSETLPPAPGYASRQSGWYYARDADRTAGMRRRWLKTDRDCRWVHRRAAGAARELTLAQWPRAAFRRRRVHQDDGPGDRPGPPDRATRGRALGRLPANPPPASGSAHFPKPSIAEADNDPETRNRFAYCETQPALFPEARRGYGRPARPCRSWAVRARPECTTKCSCRCLTARQSTLRRRDSA